MELLAAAPSAESKALEMRDVSEDELMIR